MRLKLNFANSSVARVVAFGQAGFLACILACFILVPSYLHSEGGVSNYGTLRRTIVFYSLGFLLAVYSSILAAYRLGRQQRVLSRSLFILAALFAAVLISTYPYKINLLLTDIHELSGIALFTFETGLSIWLYLTRSKTAANTVFFATFLIGSAISLITTVGLVHLLFVGQAITAIAFASLLVNSLALTRLDSTLLEN